MPILSRLLDFLFPKPAEVYVLEELSAGELLARLPAASDMGESTIALWQYADPRVRSLIYELKYRKNTLVARHLSEVLYDTLKHELAERALFDASWRHGALLIPLPQSRERRLERGWNQTEILCQEISNLDTEKLFDYRPDLLLKDRHTESQSRTKNKRTRLENVAHSMRVANPHEVEGKCIILIDDVTTTGATFAEAKRVLREAGVREVLSAALAH